MDIFKLLTEEIKKTEERYKTLVYFYNERSQIYGTLISLLRLMEKQQIVLTKEDMEEARKYLVSFIPEDDNLTIKLLENNKDETGQESS